MVTDYIEVTKELLDKETAQLTEAEKNAIDMFKRRVERAREFSENANQMLQETCPLTCSGVSKYMIPCSGWARPIITRIREIEMLNREGLKHGVIATFDQIKEKYGTYRGYWTLSHPKVDLGGTDITKMVFAYDELFENDMEDRIEKLVGQIETDCQNVCERCGNEFQMDIPGYKKCCSHGWISYLCETCAKASGNVFTIEGEPGHLFHRGLEIIEDPYKKGREQRGECAG